MDVGVYELSDLSNEQVKEKVRKRESFKIKGIEALKFNETVNTVEKIVEAQGLKCRVYTAYRAATMGVLAASNPVTTIAGLGAALGIAAHNIATWNPDYEIGKHLASGMIEVNYKK